MLGGFFCSPEIKGDIMTEILRLQKICFSVGDSVILNDVTVGLKEREIIGIVGRNGSGKSTLLSIIAGELESTTGLIDWKTNSVRLKYVQQEREAFDTTFAMKDESRLRSEWNVAKDISFEKMSGGEKLKSRLAEAFACDVNVLLLDEPTNHLDESSVETLITQMKNFQGSIVVVSHDRAFLDKVVDTIWAIEDGQMYTHSGNYSSYAKWRAKKREEQQKQYGLQQKKIAQIETQMEELRSWSDKAHTQSTKQEGFKEYYRVKAKRMDSQIRSKQKRLKKELDKHRVERPSEEHSVQFTFETNRKVGKRFLEVKELSKGYGDRILFENANFTIGYGEKIALVGENGSGKTTFLNMVMGQEMYDGELWLSPTAQIGYLTQNVFDLPLKQTPAEYFVPKTFKDRGNIQNLMKHLGFTANHWQQPIEKLSMGERVKLKLMSFILEEKDVLLLDEPTNHLDLPSREQLEETLASYGGTLLIVSHDQYFMEKITDTNLYFDNRTLRKEVSKENMTVQKEDERLLALEAERQAVLGKLSFLSKKDAEYEELDRRFVALTKEIRELKENLS